ncbi:MAG: NTP transferase domain-containing protein [Deltaproteobacteria bacterium]|nr:NTP transferase domain-containing protein [Deltaproteobacteria bacterium]
MRPPVGIIPAAGLGTRMPSSRYPKELLPILYQAKDGGIVPRPILCASLDQMRRAGIGECVIVIADWKLELVRVLGDGAGVGVALAYAVRSVPRGLTDALIAALPWVGERDVCLALPDTMIAPDDAIAQVCAERARSGADLVLGVFPTDIPEQLGPVRLAPDGAVDEVLDKPATTDVRNTWGVAVWSPRFTALVEEAIAAGEQPVLGAVYQRAIERGLAVRAVHFATGSFTDLGTPEGLAIALAAGTRPLP